MESWNFFTAKELRPSGWLRRQLEIQATGLCGNLDKVWPDVRDSAWIGGSAEGWERVPYWLDGFLPLAYLLDDAGMIARAQKYVDAILAHQREDGWICPCEEDKIPHYDNWAVQLIAKVLVVYYDCSGDERAPLAVYRIMKNYHTLLSCGKIKLFDWGKMRWFEAFVTLNFLWDRYGEAWIRDLARILREQGTDYRTLVAHWQEPKNEWTHFTHVVNLAMMLKYEAISYELLGEEYTDAAERLLEELTAHHGTPFALFTGDECLSGLSPIQGTELCAVCEGMYAYEWLYAKTGDKKWAERLELLAFNALPATLSDDMWAHQYVQMSNQIAATRQSPRPIFRTNNGEANLFGLEPNFGCCTANFAQGWPKLALSTFLYREDTVLSALPCPATLTTKDYSISLETEYPFSLTLHYRIRASAPFLFKIRVPSFAQNLRLNGAPHEKTDTLTFAIAANEEREITLAFDCAPTLVARPNELFCAQSGSLLFSLPIAYEKRAWEYEKDGVLRKFPYCDYEYLPRSPWAYAFGSPSLTRREGAVGEIPFDSQNPPVFLEADMVPIAWGYEEGFGDVCAKRPQDTTPLSAAEKIRLVPYGCAKLRMTEMPLIKLSEEKEKL